MRILITGGAGYIGSHVTQAFLQQGYTDLIVVDNLSTGDPRNVVDVPLIQADIRDFDALQSIFKKYTITAVCHLAASTVISQSIINPLGYYQNNVVGTLQLVKAAVEAQVPHFIYSSTAAIYAPSETPLNESSLLAPSNPYGRSKWMGEQILQDVTHASANANSPSPSYSLSTAILRYFNVAGASPCGRIGQRGPATHLIKNAVRTALQQQPTLCIYGNDYPTPDGTCIRDFIHVSDLAMAHVKALEYLQKSPSSLILNCGYGKGYSVKEVIQALEQVIERPLPIEYKERRAGDLPCVIADNRAILKTLNWQPQFQELQRMLETAYFFESSLSLKSHLHAQI